MSRAGVTGRRAHRFPQAARATLREACSLGCNCAHPGIYLTHLNIQDDLYTHLRVLERTDTGDTGVEAAALGQCHLRDCHEPWGLLTPDGPHVSIGAAPGASRFIPRLLDVELIISFFKILFIYS